MSNTDIVRLQYPCDGLRSALDVRYCRCSDRCRVSFRFVMFSRFVGVSSNKVCVVVVPKTFSLGNWFRLLSCP